MIKMVNEKDKIPRVRLTKDKPINRIAIGPISYVIYTDKKIGNHIELQHGIVGIVTLNAQELRDMADILEVV